MTARPAPALDAAARVAAGAARLRYDGLAMSLHWLTALLVVTQFALAELWDGVSRPARHEMIMFHMSFGILLTAVIAARIVWRLTPGHQAPSAVEGWVERASRTAHLLLYLLLVAEAVLGWLRQWGGGHALSFFGLSIPSPLERLPRPTRHLIGEAHNVLAWAIIILATGHALAALYHHFIVRDQVLARMLPQRRLRRGGA